MAEGRQKRRCPFQDARWTFHFGYSFLCTLENPMNSTPTKKQSRRREQQNRSSQFVSCALNRRSENVAIEAIVIAELKFRDVQRQVFRANFVECTYRSALNKRPEAFDCIGMH